MSGGSNQVTCQKPSLSPSPGFWYDLTPSHCGLSVSTRRGLMVGLVGRDEECCAWPWFLLDTCVAGFSKLVVGCYAWLHTKPIPCLTYWLQPNFVASSSKEFIYPVALFTQCIVKFNVMYSFHVRRLWMDKTSCVICALRLWCGPDPKDHRNSTRNIIDLCLSHSEVCYGRTQMVVKYSSERLVHIYQTV